jgi:hypothetical protein
VWRKFCAFVVKRVMVMKTRRRREHEGKRLGLFLIHKGLEVARRHEGDDEDDRE